MCGGSANSRCLPSIENGERTNPAASRPPRASVVARALIPAVTLRGLEADAVRGPAADHQEVTGLRRGAVAVAEQVAARDLVHVEQGGGHLQRAAVAEPELGADPRAERQVGVGRAQLGQLAGGEVADPRSVSRGSSAATTSFISR